MAPRSEEQFEAIRNSRKEQILETALELFAEDGYHLSSISKIAKKAGISKGLLYNYFDSKEAVLKALMQKIMSDIVEGFPTQKPENFSEEDVMKWIDYSIEITLKDLKRARLYLTLSTQPEVTPIFMELATEPIQQFMGAMIAFFQSKGIENSLSLVRHIAAMMDGIQIHIILDPENYPVEDSIQYFKDYIKSLYK